MRSNYFWSPDSQEIVFLHMDETKVPIYPITDWMPTHPTVDNEKYPKVGDPNPVVKLGVVDADKGKVRWISLTSDEESYIPRFGWVREGVIWAEVLNRTEDKMDLYFVDAKSGKSRIVLTETTPGAWIDFDQVEVRFLKIKGTISVAELARWQHASLPLQLRQAEPDGGGCKAGAATDEGRLRGAGN